MVVPLGSGLARPAEKAADEEEPSAAERCTVEAGAVDAEPVVLLWGGAGETEEARLLETAAETEEEAANPAFEIEEAVPSGGFSSCGEEEEVDVLDAVEAAERAEPALAAEMPAVGAEQAAVVNAYTTTAMVPNARNFIKPPKGNG